MKIDPQQIADILQDCAEQYILPRYKNLTTGDIQTKSHAHDFVTIADTETEEALCRILPQIVPGCRVVGEEGVSSGAITTASLSDPAQTIFVVDPVDGTANFKDGKREFATMVALVTGGQTRMAWIYDILGQAHYIGEQGQGAFCNGTRLAVAAPKPLADCIGYARKSYFPTDLIPRMGYLDDARKKVAGVKPLFCAAHEYIRIASGHADFSISGMIKPWDHLAGCLLVQEAGGVAMKWDRTPYAPHDDGREIMVATHPVLWDQLYDLFLKDALS